MNNLTMFGRLNNKKWIYIVTMFLFISFMEKSQPQALIVNEILVTVNDLPVTSMDITFMRQRAVKIKEIFTVKIKTDKDALDYLINQRILYQIAEEETIRAPQDKLDTRIKLIVQANRLKSKEALDKKLKRRGSSLEIYREEIEKQLVTHQIMNLFVPVSAPGSSEMKKWYKKNKRKLGLVVHLKQIVMKFRAGSIKDEVNVDKKMKQIRNQIVRKKKTFEKLASQYSHDRRSAQRGGDLGWVNLAELDQMKAGMAYQLRKQRRGAISRVFKSKRGNEYILLKLMGIRDIKYKSIKEKIFKLLYAKAQDKAFADWIKIKKSEAAIIFYNNGIQSETFQGIKRPLSAKKKKNQGLKRRRIRKGTQR